MSDVTRERFTHMDIELMRVRLALTPGQRLQAMLDARAVLVGFMRGRLRQRFPELSDRDLNLKLLKEIDRAQALETRPDPLPGYPA